MRLWESVEADVFTIDNKHYLCPVDYHSKFLGIMQEERLSADNVINICQNIFSKYGLPSKIVSDVGTNSVSEEFKTSVDDLAYIN